MQKYLMFVDRNIGMFEKTEQIKICINNDVDGIEGKKLSLETVDPFGKAVACHTIEDCTADLGCYPVGWYRVYVMADGERVVDQEYFAFTVTVPYANRYKGESCFATDIAGEYEPRTMRVAEEVVRAAKLQGFELARGRSKTAKWDETSTEYREKLRDGGMKTMSVCMNGYQSMPKIRELDLRDVYNVFKDAPEMNEVKSDIIELVNEPDLMYANPALPDAITAYCKMACIGVADSVSKPYVAMPGLALGRDDIYSDIMMQNGILEYSPIYNFHGYDQLAPLSIYARKVSLSYAPDGEARTSYMTENGKKAWCGDDDVLYDDHMMNMAKYSVTASSEMLSGGLDKWFWFISRAFLESGGGFGSYHAWTHQPYPVTASLANMTYQLGRGLFAGRLASLPEKCSGYLFDNGEGCHVATLWSPESCEVTLKANHVTRIDLFGKEEQIEGDGKVTVEVNEYPCFVRFEGRADEKDYYKTDFDVTPLRTLTYTKAQRVVPNVLWMDQDLSQAMVMQKGYLLKGGKSESLVLRIYNMNGEAVKGKAYIVAEYPDQLDITIDDPCFEIEPWGEARINITLDPKCGCMNCVGDIKFGAVLEGLGEIVGAVCRYWFKAEDMPIADEDIVEFKDYTNVENWDIKNIDSTGYIETEVEGEELTFHIFHGEKHAQWVFPVYTVQNPEILDGTDGIVLRKKNSFMTNRDKLTAFILTKDGRSFWSGHSSGAFTSTDWRTVTYPWETFTLYSSPEGLNDIRPLIPSEIVKVRIGVSGTSKITMPDISIKKFGAYYDRLGTTVPHPEKIRFEGIEEGEKCSDIKSRILVAYLPERELCDVRVFIGKKKAEKWSVDGKIVNIDVSHLERGEHVVQVSAKTATDYRYMEVITFFVE